MAEQADDEKKANDQLGGIALIFHQSFQISISK